MARLARLLVFVIMALGAIGAGVALWGNAQLVSKGPLETDKTIVVPRGVGLDGVARRLLEAGIIRDVLVFKIGARVAGLDKGLRAGEFSIPAATSAKGVMEILAHGKTVVRKLTVAEGLTTAQVLDHLASVEGLTGPAPASAPEGRLLPETYHFSFGDTRAGVVQRMRRDMDRLLAELWDERAPDLPLKSAEEALILASIIEKETGVASERARVAGVFVNRLRKGMRLQTDPTVVYGITNGSGPLGRPLTRKDLKTPTPYNTYVIDSLPPGPIANPGRASLLAALHPAETDELYFVADGKGGHVFAKTLKEHNRNVARWRKIRDAAK